MKKFELTSEFITNMRGVKLFRIKALVEFGNVKKGELGGYVEKEENLSHSGNAWVYGNAKVYDNAWVCGNAMVYGNAKVYDNAWVCGDAMVCGNAMVYGNAKVYNNAKICGDTKVCDNAKIYDNAKICGDAKICGGAKICGDAMVCGDAKIYDNADYTIAKGFGSECRTTTFFKCKDGSIGVKCGCFYGAIDEFRNKVKLTYVESKLAKEYLMLADLMEYHFKEGEE